MAIKILNESLTNRDILDEIESVLNNLIYEFKEYKKLNDLSYSYPSEEEYQEDVLEYFKKIYTKELPLAQDRLDEYADMLKIKK